MTRHTPDGAAAGVRRDVDGPIDLEHSAQAGRTVTALQQSLARGLPVMIPGAMGTRRASSTPPLAYPAQAPVFDRRRVEHEWEGGGAPGTRRQPDATSWLQRLGRTLGL